MSKRKANKKVKQMICDSGSNQFKFGRVVFDAYLSRFILLFLHDGQWYPSEYYGFGKSVSIKGCDL